jgi:hypothetical protein
MKDDAFSALVAFGIAFTAVAVWFAATMFFSRRRDRFNLAALRPLPKDSLLETALPNGARLFFEGRELPDLQAAKRHLNRLTGAKFMSEERISGGSPIWILRFAHHNYEFEIEMNYHAACSVYQVADPTCPDETLGEVAYHFDRRLY